MTFEAKNTEPALGLIEVESIAKGLVVADTLVKRASVKLYVSEPMTPGKYVILFRGEVAEVEEAFLAAQARAAASAIDTLILPGAHPKLIDGLNNQFTKRARHDSLGIVELHTLAATLLALDVALKRAAVALTYLQLAKGIGGKGWFTLAGSQADVEAAIEGVSASIERRLVVSTEIIERPHVDLKGPGL